MLEGAAVAEDRAIDDVDLLCDVVRLPGWTNSSSPGVWFEKSGYDGRMVVVERPTISGAFTSSVRGLAGVFRVGGEGLGPLDGLASLGLSLLCEVRGDLLLHASAVERDGRAWLFLGPGGSGKTTIATELNGGHVPFCVDKVLVSTRPDGALRVCSTPFGEGMDPSWRQRSASVAGLFFIEQADEHKVVPMSRWEAANRLLGQSVAASRDPNAVQRMIDIVGRLTDLDVSYQLRFARNASFWTFIDETMSKG